MQRSQIQGVGQAIARPPQIVKDLYIDDLSEAYEKTSCMQYLKAHVEKRTDASRGSLNQ